MLFFLKKFIKTLIEILPINNKSLFKFKLAWTIRSANLSLYHFFSNKKNIENYFLYSGSDKFINYKFVYRYLDLLLSRSEVKNVLEIGIGGHQAKYSGGASLLGLMHIYRKAHIYGVDLVDKSFIKNERLTTLVCDQGSNRDLKKIGKINVKFDLIIDDGSHFGLHQINSFKILFDYLNDEGVYIIEDLNGCFMKAYLGDPKYGIKKNTVAFFANIVPSVYSKFLIKEINARIGKFKNITKILFIDNCIVIQKKIKKNPSKSEKLFLSMTLEQINQKLNHAKSKSGLILN